MKLQLGVWKDGGKETMSVCTGRGWEATEHEPFLVRVSLGPILASYCTGCWEPRSGDLAWCLSRKELLWGRKSKKGSSFEEGEPGPNSYPGS